MKLGKRSDLFLDNKYTNWYFSIINSAQNRSENTEYTEKHHIIPKSLGGSNDLDNIVILSAKEHFIVHHLLTKMLDSKELRGKMWSAFFLMHLGHEGRVTYARTYSLAKEHMSQHKKVINAGANNPFFGKKHSPLTKQKMSNSWNYSASRNQDTTIYTFFHEVHGEHSCTRYELCKTFGLNHKYIYKIVRKVQKITKGWSVLWEKDQTL